MSDTSKQERCPDCKGILPISDYRPTTCWKCGWQKDNARHSLPVEQERDWADIWAQDFHDTYERIAPKFGYETRPESAKQWSEVPEKNRKLMQAVAAEVLCRFLNSRGVGKQEKKDDCTVGSGGRDARMADGSDDHTRRSVAGASQEIEEKKDGAISDNRASRHSLPPVLGAERDHKDPDADSGGVAGASQEGVSQPSNLVISLARELYDVFVMGGWEPQDAYQLIERILEAGE